MSSFGVEVWAEVKKKLVEQFATWIVALILGFGAGAYYGFHAGRTDINLIEALGLQKELKPGPLDGQPADGPRHWGVVVEDGKIGISPMVTASAKDSTRLVPGSGDVSYGVWMLDKPITIRPGDSLHLEFDAHTSNCGGNQTDAWGLRFESGNPQSPTRPWLFGLNKFDGQETRLYCEDQVGTGPVLPTDAWFTITADLLFDDQGARILLTASLPNDRSDRKRSYGYVVLTQQKDGFVLKQVLARVDGQSGCKEEMTLLHKAILHRGTARP